jgi:hypothetical protein
VTVDLRALPYTVLVHDGTDDLDVSALVVNIQISSNLFDTNGWVRPTGTLTLAADTDSAIDVDHATNPTRWAPGNVVSISVDGNPLPWKMCILSWGTLPGPGVNEVSIPIGTDASRKNYRAAEGPVNGGTYGDTVSRTTLINAALSNAGLPSLATGDTVALLPLDYPPEKKDAGSWVDYAGVTAAAGGHVLWQQANGDIRADRLTLDGLTAFKHYVVGTNEADYVRDSAQDSPPEVCKVTGTTYLLETVGDESFTNTYTENGHTVRVTSSYSDRNTSNPVVAELTEQEWEVVFPEDAPTVTLIDAYRKTVTYTYNATTKRLESQQTIIRQPQGVVFPQRAWTTKNTPITAQEITITYTYNSDGEVEERKTVTRIPLNPSSAATLTTVETVIERWERAGTNSDEYLYSRAVNNERPDSGLFRRSFPSSNQRPPATQYRPAPIQKREQLFSGTATFDVAGTALSEKPWVISFPGGQIRSSVQCQGLAELHGRIRHGRQYAITWAADLSADWLTNYGVIKRIDFTYDGSRKAYLAEAIALTLTPTEASIGGSAIEIGTVASDGTGTPTPPYTIS